MKKLLVSSKAQVWHFDHNGNRVEGPHKNLWGDVSDLRGDVTDLRGDVSGVRGRVSGIQGDVSGLRGDVSGVRGNVSGIWGNVDMCEITDAEREAGVDISYLILGKED